MADLTTTYIKQPSGKRFEVLFYLRNVASPTTDCAFDDYASACHYTTEIMKALPDIMVGNVYDRMCDETLLILERNYDDNNQP